MAQSSKYREAVKELLIANNSVETFQVGIKGMIENMKVLKSEVPNEIWDKIEVELLKTSLEELVDLMAPVYYKHISEKDLKKTVAFFQSPAGKRFAEKSPQITQDSMIAGQEWGQKIGRKLAERLQEEGY